MGKKRFNAEQIITKLRQIEVLLGQGKSAIEACRAVEISEQTYYGVAGRSVRKVSLRISAPFIM